MPKFPKAVKQTNASVEEVTKTLTGIVHPNKRADVKIISDHVLPLTGTKSKKQLSRKRRAVKKKTLTRKERSEMGLYSLPTNSLKYTDMLALHDLWKGYMQEHLGLATLEKVPTVVDRQYDEFSKLLVKTDLHGARITVSRSKCPSFVGTSGIVVLDTKNTLKMLGQDNKLRTVPKAECIFTFELGHLEFTIVGKHLTIRPAERSVKKVKNFMDLDL